MNYLAGVNRLLLNEGILAGDDDDIASFSETQHVISTKLAKEAIADEIVYLIAQHLIDYEDTTAVLTYTGGSRTVALASDFIKFVDPFPGFLRVTAAGASLGEMVAEWPGGQDNLKFQIYDYREQTTSNPSHWYWERTTTKTIGFYPVLTSGQTLYYRYNYRADVSVENETDTLPFANESEARLFCHAAQRRFREKLTPRQERQVLFPQGIENDAALNAARASLMELMRPEEQSPSWGRHFR